jgi:hypothetical protein
MPLVQIRDLPEHLYRLLAEQAARERRSLAPQAVAALARGLAVSVDNKARRGALLDRMRTAPRLPGLTSPARLIREDRRR